MEIKSCRTYHGILDGFKLLKMNDGKSVFKIYYVSIIGRDKPEVYEWSRCPLKKTDYEASLRAKPVEGIGFITAFPHITKVFRFSPEVEIVMDVAAFDTQGLASRKLERSGGYYEFACYAEAVIATEEYHAWARARTVDDYLQSRGESSDYKIAKHDKLAKYW